MLHVERVGPLVTIQDAGRFGHARHGVPASGPLDNGMFRRTVAAIGADTAIEIPLMGARFRFSGEISIDGDVSRVDGPFEVPAVGRAVRYLAVAGGLAVDEVLGSRSTLVNASIGTMLRAGDAIAIGERHGRRATIAIEDGPIVLLPTFDADVTPLLTTRFVIDPRSDRVGVRLRGTVPPLGERLSRPIVPGAIQLPHDGNPIVIGPDGPTTGGYPVVAVLPRASRDRLARLRPLSEVRFHLA